MHNSIWNDIDAYKLFPTSKNDHETNATTQIILNWPVKTTATIDMEVMMMNLLVSLFIWHKKQGEHQQTRHLLCDCHVNRKIKK